MNKFKEGRRRGGGEQIQGGKEEGGVNKFKEGRRRRG